MNPKFRPRNRVIHPSKSMDSANNKLVLNTKPPQQIRSRWRSIQYLIFVLMLEVHHKNHKIIWIFTSLSFFALSNQNLCQICKAFKFKSGLHGKSSPTRSRSKLRTPSRSRTPSCSRTPSRTRTPSRSRTPSPDASAPIALANPSGTYNM